MLESVSRTMPVVRGIHSVVIVIVHLVARTTIFHAKWGSLFWLVKMPFIVVATATTITVKLSTRLEIRFASIGRFVKGVSRKVAFIWIPIPIHVLAVMSSLERISLDGIMLEQINPVSWCLYLFHLHKRQSVRNFQGKPLFQSKQTFPWSNSSLYSSS